MTTDALEEKAVVRERPTRSGLSEFFSALVRELTHNIERIVE